MSAFKTLHDANVGFQALETETAALRLQIPKIASLEQQLAEAKAFSTETGTENEKFRLSIVQKDELIAAGTAAIEAFKTEVSSLKTQVSELEKGQKTAKQHARELVAATGGAPMNVDQSEINKMQAGSEDEFKKMMLAEHDPKRLAQLYEQYNQLFRSKSKKR